MNKIRGVLFDVDGTLIDSNEAQAKAWVQAMAEQGHEVSVAKVGPLIGMGGDKVLPETIGIAKDSEQGKKIETRRSEIFKERYLSTLHAFPATMDLLKHMREQGLTLVIATSAKPEEMKELLAVIDPHVSELFSQEATSKDAQSSKPNPDVIQAALQRVQCAPEQVLMIGDTVYDIESAEQVGIKTVAFRSGGWSDHDLRGAIAIYDGPADLLAHYDASPFAQAL